MNKEDLLRAVHFDHPERVPVTYHVNMGCWDHYPREALAGMIRAHPALFPAGVPEFVRTGEPVPYPPWCTAGKPWTDPWGCRWETSIRGCIGAVTRHPLADWEALGGYSPPDPDKTTHWEAVEWDHVRAGRKGPIGFFDCLPSGEIGHGHTFLKLIDLLGYDKTILAMADADPRLSTVLSMIEAFNLGLVQRFLDVAGVEWLGYAEDLGMQQGPLLSPETFRRHILPLYARIMAPARERNAVIHMHSDGDIRALAPDLLTLPVHALNIQDLVNGLDWMVETLKGRVALDVDIDRQHITPSGSPEEVKAHVLDILRLLDDPAGGLILTYGLYPGTAWENAVAMAEILDEVAQGRRG